MLDAWILKRRRTTLVVAISGLLVLACSPSGPDTVPSSVPGQSPAAAAGPTQELLDAAKRDGVLTTMSLSHDRCDYGEVIRLFTERYGIAVNELNPIGDAGDQIDAIVATKDNPGPQTPDVIDVSMATALDNRELLEPYRVSTWESIPTALKDPDGAWYGAYFGTLAFETNTNLIADPPHDWPDLLDPALRGKVGLAGDPRGSNLAMETVYAAALANGGTATDVEPGLTFFKRLVDLGNLSPTIARSNTIDQGVTPIAIRWTYTALAHRDAAAGDPGIEVTVPSSGGVGGAFIQAINRYAPHPNAARLWIEHLLSDEGQRLLMEGSCTPARIADLTARGALPEGLLPGHPDPSRVTFPSPADLETASTMITQGWGPVTGFEFTDR
jgi:putative spermidine/putrescine transport system substrate-binding protein